MDDNLRIKLNNFKDSENNHFHLKLLLKPTKDITNIPIEIHFSKVRNNKQKIKGFVVILKDFIQEVRNRIQKETFIDIISRDLKTPIKANIKLLELVLRGKYGVINSELKIVFEELLRSFKYMKYMSDNLIIKYNSEFEGYELKKRKYSIVKLIKEKCQKLMKILERKNQTVELIVHNEIPEIYMDIEEINKVFKNILISASNDTSENSKITIKISSDNDSVYVSVSQGIYSMKEKILDNLFEEYANYSNKFKKAGYNLELLNCRKIIEAHGGNFTEGDIGKTGKTITFSLPF